MADDPPADGHLPADDEPPATRHPPVDGEPPAAPPPDDKDWTWVLDRGCPECGFRAAALDLNQIAPVAIECAQAIAEAALDSGSRNRSSPLTWSALEYACHARDVCSVFAARVTLMTSQDDPLFPNWDQDATAIDDRYWAQDPLQVARQLAASAAQIAALFDALAPQQWSRSGRRANGSVFTVESLGRYFVHDLVHHAHDVGRPVAV